jgi:hypothetical protein
MALWQLFFSNGLADCRGLSPVFLLADFYPGKNLFVYRASCKMNIYSDRLKITCAASSW